MTSTAQITQNMIPYSQGNPHDVHRFFASGPMSKPSERLEEKAPHFRAALQLVEKVFSPSCCKFFEPLKSSKKL